MGARWLYMLPALLLSAVAVILALIGLAREPSPPKEGQGGVIMQVTEEQPESALQYSYWVASHELNIGSTLSADDFRKVSVSVPLSQAVPAEESLAGQLLRRNVREGEILAKTHLEAGNLLARNVPAGYRAFALGIDNVSSVGGLLKPGDLVDVMVHFRNGADREPTAMILLNSIEVLAVKGRIENAVAEQDEQQARGRNATVVLAVPREDLSRLLLADSNGQVRLVMAGEARQHGDAAAPPAATGAELIRLEELFPRKAVRKQSEAVEVYRGPSSRSTYVH